MERDRQYRKDKLRDPFSIDYVSLTDKIAKDVGMFPQIKYFELEDPSLHDMLMNGPLLAQHYLLNKDEDLRKQAIRYTLQTNTIILNK